MYPHVSNYMAELQQARIINEQYDILGETSPEDLSSMLEDAHAYNAELARGTVSRGGDPLSGERLEGTGRYRSLMDAAGNGVMGVIIIPKIDVNKPIYHGVTEEVLRQGVGHMPSTSLPVGGPSTHAVLTGHTGLPSGRFFDAIDQLEKKDWFVVECLGVACAYEVTGTEVVLPHQVGSLTIEPNRDLVTLVTCTPYGVNTHRLLVHAERIDLPQEWYTMRDNGDVPPGVNFIAPRPLWPWALAGAAIALAVILVVVRCRRISESRKEAKR